MKYFSFLFGLFLLLSACSDEPSPPPSPKTDKLLLQKTSFANIPTWAEDQNKQKALSAFAKSCTIFRKKNATADFAFLGSYQQWQDICDKRPQNPTATEAEAYLTTFFTPYLVTNEKDGEKGLFTGYYEPEIQAHFLKTGPYQYPLYQRPKDIISVDLGQFSSDFVGKKITGRVDGNKLIPYYNRAEIEAGALQQKNLELLYSTSKIDNFILQIQGSGAVRLPDGSLIRIGYNGQNGRAYTAIGRPLIKMGAIAPENMSMQAIRTWLETHPQDADRIMNMNQSFVFFHLLATNGPVGAQNVVLTPRRSLAVDRRYLPYGVPLFLSAERPTEISPSLNRLVIAQDTGGAIRGIVRGDLFWGAGEDAEHNAGLMASSGQYWLLVPKTVKIDPTYLKK